MFRHALRPVFALVIRNAVVLTLAAALLYLLGVSHGLAAPQTVTRDPQALTAIASSLKALTGVVTLNDVTLQASASYIAGDQETGLATLIASGNQESLVQLNLSGGTREVIRSGLAGTWTGPDGTVHAMATHNCWQDADWFYPVFSFEALSTDTGLGLAYAGPEAKNGSAVIHLVLYRILPGQTADMTTEIQALSRQDIYLDAVTYLPLFLDFNAHSNEDLQFNIPVEMAFSGYQKFQGVEVPSRIQQYLRGALLLDLSVSSATINSGVPPSTFALAATAGGGQ